MELMELYIYVNGHLRWTEESEENESSFFYEVGKHLPDLENEIPCKLTAKSSKVTAEFQIGKRGSFVKNGVKKPSMFVKEIQVVSCFSADTYRDAYLTCVNPESNNYKFYWIKPRHSRIYATYGRIGAKKGEFFGERDILNPYPSYMYWIRYFEKISKGYIDQTDIFLEENSNNEENNKKANVDKGDNEVSDSVLLYEKLISYARTVVRASLLNDKVSFEQVKAARKFYREMGKRKTVNGFNKQLMMLLAVSPRKVDQVSCLLAQNKEDFKKILDREESLLSAMEAVAADKHKKKTSKSKNGFEALGIEVYEATEKQKKEVMKHLSDTLKPKVNKVYRVINKKHKEKFNNYIESNNIKNIRQLWHGSKNANWFSILVNGLLLKPDAEITGKMFGHGIYFAPSSMKSWNYTSYSGTYWANGTSDTGIMGLYATAYGNPYDITAPKSYTQANLDRINKNCVHAHAGNYLRNDEIIFYREDAILLNYLVEFK